MTAQLALSRHTVDRAGLLRVDDAGLARAWADDTTRVLTVGARGVTLTVEGARGPELVLRSPREAEAAGSTDERYLLGVEDGVTYFAVVVHDLAADPALAGTDAGAPSPVREEGLRDLGSTLSDREVGLLTNAVGLQNWHATHRHCPRCGAATVVTHAGHVRHCPADGSEHYPRTDAAVIMTVVGEDDRLLLGHHANWPPTRYSVLAGFVEPGESLESAVVREVGEEVGVVVTDVEYVASQPRPFPASLMVGFSSRALPGTTTPDGEEIEDAQWFSRDELDAAVAAGTLRLPPAVSIARQLIERWYGSEIVEGRNDW